MQTEERCDIFVSLSALVGKTVPVCLLKVLSCNRCLFVYVLFCLFVDFFASVVFHCYLFHFRCSRCLVLCLLLIITIIIIIIFALI